MSRIVRHLLELIRRLFTRRSDTPLVDTEPLPLEEEEITDPQGVVPVVEDDDPTDGSDEPILVEAVVDIPTLSRGSQDKEAVRELQTLLNRNGASLTADGIFGSGTERAVKEFQTSYGLPSDGVVGSAVWRILQRPYFGSDPNFTDVELVPSFAVDGSSGVAKAWNTYGNLLSILAMALEIESAMACAVLAVESAGKGFWDGRMVIRFENHIFYNHWGKDHKGAFDEHFSMDSTKKWKNHQWRADPDDPWRPLHTQAAGQDEEWAVLDFARQLDDTAALNSISMGAPQIMGFNSPKVGFDSVQEMFEAFSKSDHAHVLGLFDFIRSDHRMVRSLRAGNTTEFARIYNGTGQADYYGGKIAENTRAAKKLGVP